MDSEDDPFNTVEYYLDDATWNWHSHSHARYPWEHADPVSNSTRATEGKFDYLKQGIVDLPQYTSLSSFRDLPAPVWIDIISHVSARTDLLHLAQASTMLYHLALRPLYYNVQYVKFASMENNPEFWVGRQDNLASATTSLTLGSNASHASTPLSRFCIGRFEHREKSGFLLHHWDSGSGFVTKTNSVPSHILRFGNLESLRLNAIPVPPEIYDILLSLPRLRNLCLSECGLDEPVGMRNESDWDWTLPLTELTLKSVRWHSPSFHHPRHELAFIDNCPDLVRLRMDWDAETAYGVVKSGSDTGLLTFQFPDNLEYLELRTFPQATWPEPQGASDPVLTTALIKLLRASEGTLRTLRVNGFLPSLSLSSSSLGLHSLSSAEASAMGSASHRFRAPSASPHSYVSLVNLRTYVGPLPPMASLLHDNEVLEELVITEYDQDVGAFTRVFGLDTLKMPKLRVLKVCVREWDVEMMHAVVQLFPGLRELSVLYQVGYPSEDNIITLGAEFLSRLVRLQVLHLYNPRVIRDSRRRGLGPKSSNRPDFGVGVGLEFLNNLGTGKRLPRHSSPINQSDLGPCADPQGECLSGQFLAAWRRYTPYLREVRLVREFVWRRDIDVDVNVDRGTEAEADCDLKEMESGRKGKGRAKGERRERSQREASTLPWTKRPAKELEKEIGAVKTGWVVDPEF